MATYIYAPTNYVGTSELIELLGAKRLRKHDGMYFINKGALLSFHKKDVIICWGGHIPASADYIVINGSAKFRNTLELNTKLTEFSEGVITTFAPIPMKLEEYTKSLEAQTKPTFTKGLRNGQIIASPDLFGYGHKHYPFDKQELVVVSTNKLKPQDVYAILLNKLGLSFARIKSGFLGDTPYLHMLQTGWDLTDAAQVKQVAAIIYDLVAKKLAEE